MKRLAKLNNCETVEDFNNKFFAKLGNEVLLEAPAQKSNQPVSKRPLLTDKNSPKPKDSVEVSDNTRIEKPKIQQSNKNTTPKIKLNKNTNSSVAEKINSMPDDTSRIVEYNKKHYNGKYYGIVDKKACQIKIYDKSGQVVKTFSVGLGKAKGDNLMSFGMSSNAVKRESGRYTTAGEYTLDEFASANDVPDSEIYTSKKDNKLKAMELKGDSHGEESYQLAIHMVPTILQGRNKNLKSPTTADNRVSYGCINLLESDYDQMHKYLGEGNKIYVLPEEKGNKLQLEKQKDGSYKFEQAYHRNDKRSLSKEQASVVNYDVRKERDPKLLAKQKTQKAAPQKGLAQQQPKAKSQKYEWYDPRRWLT